MIFDSHAHYDDEAFNEDREAILNSLPENGISPIVNVSAQLSGVTATVELTEKYPFIYGSVGVHPDHVGELSEEKIQWMKELAGREKIVAVGEIGLDHYWDTESDEVQRKWFIRQLELAKEVNLPVIIHSREASQETFDIMKEHHAGSTGGVIHCYSGSKRDGCGVSENGLLYRYRWRCHLQKRPCHEGSGSGRSPGADSDRDGLPLSRPHALPRKTKFFAFSPLCHRRDCEAQRNRPQNGGGDHLGKCNEDV